MFSLAKCINRQGFSLLRKEFHLSSSQFLASKEFEEAKVRLNNLKEDPGSDVKLKIYALFKQATVGPCNAPKPSMVDFVGRAKYNAWNELKLTQAEAEKEYIRLVNELANAEAPSDNNSSNATTGKYQEILTSIEYNTVYKIVLNRPTKLNAITQLMYRELTEALKEADSNSNVTMVVITGAGNYFCSGNDLTNFNTKEAMTNIRKAAEDGGVILENFVNSFVNVSKPLVALVNGPAVGISVTILGLFDLVICSDKATFNTPFTRLAQSPEACSSYTFPKMMGTLKANEMLLFNRKLNAFEAYERNLVTEVIEDADFQKKAWEKIESFSKLPKESLLMSRRIVRDGEKEFLRKVNKAECDILADRWSSPEFARVIMEFMTRPKAK